MLSSRQSSTSLGSGSLCTMGRATLPAGFLLMGLVSESGGGRTKQRAEENYNYLSARKLEQSIFYLFLLLSGTLGL